MREFALFIAAATGLFASTAFADRMTVYYGETQTGMSFKDASLGGPQDDQNSVLAESDDSFSYVARLALLPDAEPQKSGTWNLSKVLGSDYFWFAQFRDKPQGRTLPVPALDGAPRDSSVCYDATCASNSIGILASDLFDGAMANFDSGFTDTSAVTQVSTVGARPLTFDSRFWYAGAGTSSAPLQASGQSNASNNAISATTGIMHSPAPPVTALFVLVALGLPFLRRTKKT